MNKLMSMLSIWRKHTWNWNCWNCPNAEWWKKCNDDHSGNIIIATLLRILYNQIALEGALFKIHSLLEIRFVKKNRTNAFLSTPLHQSCKMKDAFLSNRILRIKLNITLNTGVESEIGKSIWMNSSGLLRKPLQNSDGE